MNNLDSILAHYKDLVFNNKEHIKKNLIYHCKIRDSNLNEFVLLCKIVIDSKSRNPIVVIITDHTVQEKFEKLSKDLREKDKIVQEMREDLKSILENSRNMVEMAVEEGLEECIIPVKIREVVFTPLLNFFDLTLNICEDLIDCGNMKLSRMRFKMGMINVSELITDALKLFLIPTQMKNIELICNIEPKGDYLINTDGRRLL